MNDTEAILSGIQLTLNLARRPQKRSPRVQNIIKLGVCPDRRSLEVSRKKLR